MKTGDKVTIKASGKPATIKAIGPGGIMILSVNGWDGVYAADEVEPT